MACRDRESCWCFGAATPQRAPSPPQNGLCSPSTSNGRASPAPLPSVLRKIEKWGDYEAVGGLVPVRLSLIHI